MNYIIGALAVYKVLQVLDALTPKEAMPWVKIIFGVLLGYIVTMLIPVDHKPVAGLVIATLAGTCHGLLRLVTLLGDMAKRKASR
jgi:F0F1-type ATP synthase assembly protein I